MSDRLEKIKKLIAEENSPEILRALILKTCEENERLSKLLSEIEAEKARQSQSQLNIEDEIKALPKESDPAKKGSLLYRVQQADSQWMLAGYRGEVDYALLQFSAALTSCTKN